MPPQNAVYGFITDIIELDEAVELHFQVLNRIPQQTVLSLADSLAFREPTHGMSLMIHIGL